MSVLGLYLSCMFVFLGGGSAVVNRIAQYIGHHLSIFLAQFCELNKNSAHTHLIHIKNKFSETLTMCAHVDQYHP